MSKFLKTTFLCGILLLATANASSSFTPKQWEETYQNAILSSPLVAQMHEDGLKRRSQESFELELLRAHVSDLYGKDTFELKDLQAAITKDLAVFQAMDPILKKYAIDTEHMTFQLYYNKMALNLQIALELLQDKWVVPQIFDVNVAMPQGFDFKSPAMNFCGDGNHIYASKRGNGLKVLLTTACRLGAKASSLGTLQEVIDIEKSPFLHLVQLPDSFQMEGLEEFPYFFSDAKTPKGIFTIHNGYAFGGHRNEPRYLGASKPFGPQDCSSIVAKYLCPVPCTTMQLAYHWQGKHGFYFKEMQGYADPAWQEHFEKWQRTDAWSKSIDTSFNPIIVEDLSRTTPGMTHVERTYTNNQYNGAGGHAGILLGILGQGPDAKSLTLSTNRDLEGAGYEFSYGAQERQALPSWETKRLVTYFETR